METLYVCLFSNGHIKVGRSIDANARIASHADRVACMGVSLASSYQTECPDACEARERVLIDLARNAVDNGVPLHEANVFPADTTQHAWFTHAYWARHRELTEAEA